MTFTVDPADATSVPAGIIANPLARATVEIRFDPRAPVGAADQPASPRRTSTRAYWSFPRGPRTSSVSLAVT